MAEANTDVAPVTNTASNPTVATTTISSTALSDQLSSSIPKLDPSSLNWAIFSIHFQDAIEAKGFWGHFDGSEAKPVPADANSPTTEDSCCCSLGEERTLSEIITDPKTPRFGSHADTEQENSQRMMGRDRD